MAMLVHNIEILLQLKFIREIESFQVETGRGVRMPTGVLR